MLVERGETRTVLEADGRVAESRGRWSGTDGASTPEGVRPDDVPTTWADVDALREAVGFAPATSVDEGAPRFVVRYREFCAT